MARNALFFLGSVALLGCTSVGANAAANFLDLSRLHAIEGEYVGEVRQQSADGKVNRLLSPQAHVSLSIQGDEVLLHTASDLAGAKCRSKVGSILELMTYAKEDPHLLKAEFSFDPSRCASKLNSDSVLVLLAKDPASGELVLETLLTRAGSDHEIQNRKAGQMSVHGYFTMVNPSSIIK